MLELMKYVLCVKDDTDVAMMTAFRKQIAHTPTGISRRSAGHAI